MKYSSIYFTFVVSVVSILCDTTWAQTQNTYDLECAKAKTDWICFADSTLGKCIQVTNNNWQGIAVLKCDSSACCDPRLGCKLDCDSKEECAHGDLKKDPTDPTCKMYYYCALNKWAGPEMCPYGVFDEDHKTCSTNAPCRQ